MSPLRRHERRTIAGLAALWLAVWYGVGVGLAGVHVAATEHHVEPWHDDHACSREHAATPPAMGPHVDAAAPEDHCCHLLHDALPGTTTGSVIDQLSSGAAKRVGDVVAGRRSTDAPRLTRAVDHPPAGRPPGGDLAAAAGRAPPFFLHA